MPADGDSDASPEAASEFPVNDDRRVSLLAESDRQFMGAGFIGDFNVT